MTDYYVKPLDCMIIGQKATATRAVAILVEEDYLQRAVGALEVIALQVGDLVIPWPGGMTFKEALLAWRNSAA